MGKIFLRKILQLTLAGVTLALLIFPAAATSGKEPSGTGPRLQGTFLQLTAAQGDWQPDDWARLFGYFRQLHLSQLVIQWTVYDDLSFSPAPDLRQVPHPPLAAIFQQADEAGLQVWLGLAHDSGYWEKIRRDPALVAVYLRRLRRRDEALAGRLAAQFGNHRFFRGWYITEEVDDVNWQEAPAQEVLFAYLRDLSKFLHELTPGAGVAISGFANGRTDPRAFADFWRNLLAAANIDVVFFQDGVGAGKLSLAEVAPYLAALRQAVQSQSRTLQVVVELFHRISERPFRAQAASWDRVARQLEIASRYSTGGILAFSVPDYLTPLAGPEADRLFEAYWQFIKSKRELP